MSHVQELIEKVRNANNIAKTARERVKTASASEDLGGRGDLLANTIYKITAQEEERVFPEEVRLRKEAAEKAALGKDIPAKEPAKVEDAGEEPASEKNAAETAPTSGVVKEAETTELQITDVYAFMNNPLVKRGFEEVLDENADTIRRCAGAIISKAGAL